MTAQATADATLLPPKPADLPASDRVRVLFYLSVLVFMLGYAAPNGGLIDTPISFFLKNRLHLKAHELADFRFVAGIPLYLAFLWGFVRDNWNPFGRRDRGYMVMFGVIGALGYAFFAFLTPSTTELLAAVILLTSAYLFVLGAQTGLSATIARQHVMTGQWSSVFNVVGSIAGLVPLVAGGYLSNLLESKNADLAARILFLTGGAAMTATALYALWRPSIVFDNIREEQKAFHPLHDIGRLFSHWPVYPALLIWFLWNFAPGSVTPLQYYLQNTLHADDAAWGNWQAIFAGAFIPTFALYGFLCRKLPLRTLLFWGTIAGVPQMIPLLFTPTVTTALIAAAPIGLMGGVASAAYIDLLIRSCPKGLESTMLMAANSLYFLVGRGGDILGTNLYEGLRIDLPGLHARLPGGFGVCVVAITIVYALIIPTLWLVPRRLTATPDGIAPEGGFDAEADRPELAF